MVLDICNINKEPDSELVCRDWCLILRRDQHYTLILLNQILDQNAQEQVYFFLDFSLLFTFLFGYVF